MKIVDRVNRKQILEPVLALITPYQSKMWKVVEVIPVTRNLPRRAKALTSLLGGLVGIGLQGWAISYLIRTWTWELPRGFKLIFLSLLLLAGLGVAVIFCIIGFAVLTGGKLNEAPNDNSSRKD
jgi:uncharacterized membrane protein